MNTNSTKRTENAERTPWPHTFSLEERKKALLSGVREVLAFDENQVVLLTDAGEICMTGQNLHVTKLMVEEGHLAVEGHVDGIWYNEHKARRTWLRKKT